MKKLIGVLIMVLTFSLASSMAFSSDEEVEIWKDGKLNVNGATKELLLKVGVKDDLADAILGAREEAEEFVDIEEMMDIEGVNAKKMRELKKLLYVEVIPDCGC